jgi:hypothetical protein
MKQLRCIEISIARSQLNGATKYIFMNYHRKDKGELISSTHGVCTNRFTHT